MIQAQLGEYLKLKERMKDYQEQLKFVVEEIEDYFYQSGEEKLYFDISDTEMIVLEKKFTVAEKLDKDGLSLETNIPKDEMKTPFDWSMLTKQDKIEPKLISKYTFNETGEKVKITKKRKPKRSKKFAPPEGQESFWKEDTGIPMNSGEKMVLTLNGGEATLTKYNEDGTTTEIPSVTTTFE